MKVLKFQRGQIWWYRTDNNFDGSVQGKSRPVIIMSNNFANKYSKNLLAIPCTTQEKKSMPTHTSFDIDGTSNIALAENLISVNIERLKEYIGTVDDELLSKLETNVMVALGLNNNSINNVIEDKVKIQDTESKILTESKPVISIKKSGRKPKYNYEDMTRFVNDYNNHNAKFMMSKYNEVSEKAVQNKVYRFRKILEEGK